MQARAGAWCFASVMHVVPADVVKAVSLSSRVVALPRNAIWYSAGSAGRPASTQAIASAIGTPGGGATDAAAVGDRLGWDEFGWDEFGWDGFDGDGAGPDCDWRA